MQRQAISNWFPHNAGYKNMYKIDTSMGNESMHINHSLSLVGTRSIFCMHANTLMQNCGRI
jgi:hypothetical protein